MAEFHCEPFDVAPSNASHDLFVAGVADGSVLLLEDVELAGGRQQTGAELSGPEVELITWHQHRDGNWHCASVFVLRVGWLTRLRDWRTLKDAS